MQEFVSNPTPATQTIIDDIAQLENEYYAEVPHSGLKKFMYGMKKEVEFKTAYRHLLRELSEAEQSWKQTTQSLLSLKEWYAAFLSFYRSIIVINSLIVHAHIKLKQHLPRNEYLTKEDEKNQLLHQIARNEKTADDFKALFGHYSPNPFELSSRRFHEYRRKEIKALAGLFDTFTLSKTKRLAHDMNEPITNDKELFMVYVTLREAYKYHAIRYIDAMYGIIRTTHPEKTIYDQSLYTLMEEGQ